MFPLGRRRPTEEPSEMVRECHVRIRGFLGVADRLASDEPAPDDDVRGAAAMVGRYFADALPLHERDEDESIAPRLRGRRADLDRALDDMHAQHEAMHPRIVQLVALCARLTEAAEPQVARVLERPELRALLADFEPRMAAHLAAEESIVLPAVDDLPLEDRAELIGELRARRVPIP